MTKCVKLFIEVGNYSLLLTTLQVKNDHGSWQGLEVWRDRSLRQELVMECLKPREDTHAPKENYASTKVIEENSMVASKASKPFPIFTKAMSFFSSFWWKHLKAFRTVLPSAQTGRLFELIQMKPFLVPFISTRRNGVNSGLVPDEILYTW